VRVIASGQAVISEDDGQFQRVSQLAFFGLRFWLSAMISFCATVVRFCRRTGVAGNDQIQIAGSMMRHTGTLARCRRHHSSQPSRHPAPATQRLSVTVSITRTIFRIGKGISAVSLAGYMTTVERQPTVTTILVSNLNRFAQMTGLHVRLCRLMCGGGYAPPSSSHYIRAMPLVRLCPSNYRAKGRPGHSQYRAVYGGA